MSESTAILVAEIADLKARAEKAESELTRQSGLTQHCPLCEGWAKKLEKAEAALALIRMGVSQEGRTVGDWYDRSVELVRTIAARDREIEALRDLLEVERKARQEAEARCVDWAGKWDAANKRAEETEAKLNLSDECFEAAKCLEKERRLFAIGGLERTGDIQKVHRRLVDAIENVEKCKEQK